MIYFSYQSRGLTKQGDNKMINTRISKNKSWDIGDKVNIGFMKDLVVSKIEVVHDGMPDIYTLVKGDKVYEFIPHNGLTRVI